MANELTNLADAVYDLLGEITTFKRIHKNEPDSIETVCEVAILTDIGVSGQQATMMHRDTHTLRIRVYIPRQHGQEAETTMRQLWDAMRAKFTNNVTLNGTAQYCNLDRYTTGYQVVAGVLCRIMDAFLTAQVKIGTTYAS